MKGAIGNAFLLNIVITIVLVFFVLLIGTMAFSKTYKIKNYLINAIDTYEDTFEDNQIPTISKFTYSTEWSDLVNPYLRKAGYHLSNKKNACPIKENKKIFRDTKVGDYEYCIYRTVDYVVDEIFEYKYYYTVLVYMKMDLPLIGKYIKLPLKGDTKTYYKYK